MRKKENYYILTFRSTMQAIQTEKRLKELQGPGRIIPLPGEIAAGCGLAYCVVITEKGNLQKLLKDNQIDFQNDYEIIL